jgi:hypothetical protein
MALDEKPQQLEKAREYLERTQKAGGSFGEEAKKWLAELSK